MTAQPSFCLNCGDLLDARIGLALRKARDDFEAKVRTASAARRRANHAQTPAARRAAMAATEQMLAARSALGEWETAEAALWPAFAAEDRHPCARCGDFAQPKPLYARGLCSACYTIIERLGLLDRYLDSAELDWVDYQWLRSWGVSIEQCAERLGMEFRTALKYERRRRGADYDAWLASLSDQDRERYNMAA